ncbi:putative tetraspanin-1 [Apostichopus japonicus]|uniref:Tetraspanin n=1 Tax=Stichopus japonicus TaxID=307972 RepID=A0A2G8JIG3_STIJA|nr:putative tetraspanin-1 [Apostichopus japonicus]
MGDESCGTRCVQFILFMLNFIFFLCGVGLVVVSIFIWLGPVEAFNFNVIDLANILDNVYLEVGCFIMMGAGVIIIFFAIIGCCGAFLLNRLLLGLYFLIIILLFFAQLAGAVLAAIYSAEIDTFLSSEATDMLQTKYKHGNDSYSLAIDSFQMKFDCCGINGREDYDDLDKGIPGSCCGKDRTSDGKCVDADIAQSGCREELKAFLTQNTTIIGATLVGVACLELFLMVFAVLLCRNASEKDY